MSKRILNCLIKLRKFNRFKTQLKQLIEQNKLLTTENFELKQR